MRHAILVSLLAIRAIPKQRYNPLPRTTRRLANLALGYLDRRRAVIDRYPPPTEDPSR